MRYVNKKNNLKPETYHDLHQWSVASQSLSQFWQDAYSFLELAPPGAKQVGNMLETWVGFFFPISPSTLLCFFVILRGYDAYYTLSMASI
jgi:hypothetical protein